METIAQLIKLKDYVSRYEWNIYRYPSQFIRLKQENWGNLYALWSDQVDKTVPNIPEKEKTKFPKFFSFLKQSKSTEKEETNKDLLPDTEMELKHYFLNKLFPLQLKWATSTVTDISFIDHSYEEDINLKYFLNRFPDIYLLMYYPIFNIKKAPVDGEIILISPFGIEIIYLIEVDPKSTIIANDDRTWLIETNHIKEKWISPLISLKRTEHIVQSILKKEEIEFPITKIVLSKINNIVYTSEPFNTKIIGKFQYDKWFIKKRQLNSTLKSQQLKTAGALLKYCLSTSVKRPEWENEENVLSTNDYEN